MSEPQRIAMKLAGMLLLQNGRVSVSEIEALPFVRDRYEALAIAQTLLRWLGDQCPIEVSGEEDPSGISLSLAPTA